VTTAKTDQPPLDPHPDQLPGNGRLIIALSGGADSCALAHVIRKGSHAREMLCVHIDHGLDSDSAHRAKSAESIASELALPFVLERVNVSKYGNREAAARKARYQALANHMHQGDCLLTAHHADDQVETIMLRLLRGAGPRGLAGISAIRAFENGWLVRPLLAWNRAELQAYCRDHRLDWIEDPSNQELSADRNHLRHVVLPLLRERWPSLDLAVRRSGELAGRAADTLDQASTAILECNQASPGVLNANSIQALNRFQRGEVLRFWCRQSTGTVPPGKRLEEFLDQVETASKDSQPALAWQHGMLRFWDSKFWLDSDEDRIDGAFHYDFQWQCDQQLDLPGSLGQLELLGDKDQKTLTLRVANLPRDAQQSIQDTPSERLQLAPGAARRRVKELMRLAGIPPWQRGLWPRIYKDTQLVAMGDQWIDHAFAGWMKRRGLRLKWHRLESRPGNLPESNKVLQTESIRPRMNLTENKSNQKSQD